MSESVTAHSASRPALYRIAARLACVGALQLSLMACAQQSETEAEIACANGAIGTFRTIELTLDSAPLWQKLEAKEVVLTFDDGPDPAKTQQVLDVLADQCVKAAFFLRGDQAAAHPEMVRDIALAGHVLGAHGWAHGALLDMTIEDARTDIETSLLAITDALAASPETANVTVGLFRYPYLASNPDLEEIVAGLKLVPTPVHADGLDWEFSAPEEIVARVFEGLSKSGNRGAVLLHDPFGTSELATALLLQRLNEEGYRIVAIRGGGD